MSLSLSSITAGPTNFAAEVFKFVVDLTISSWPSFWGPRGSLLPSLMMRLESLMDDLLTFLLHCVAVPKVLFFPVL